MTLQDLSQYSDLSVTSVPLWSQVFVSGSSVGALRRPEADTPTLSASCEYHSRTGSVARAADDMIPRGASNSCKLQELPSLEV